MPCEAILPYETCPKCGWRQGSKETHPVITSNHAKPQVGPVHQEMAELREKVKRLEAQLGVEKG